MRRLRGLAAVGLAAIAGQALAAPTRADWTGCQVEQGVLVVPAQAAGLTGPFILDTGTAQSLLDATQASLAGLGAGEAQLPVRLGGRRWPKLAMTVVALDERTRDQPTPITGVLGADVLEGLVLEVRQDPCRFRLTARPDHAGRASVSLPVERRAGVPYVLAGVSDGVRSERGLMQISTGADLAVRLGPDAARLAGAPANAQNLTAPLRALSLGDVLVEYPQGAITAQASPGALGEIGEPIWAGYDLVLDLRRGRLSLFDAAKSRARRRAASLVFDVPPQDPVAGVEQAGE